VRRAAIVFQTLVLGAGLAALRAAPAPQPQQPIRVGTNFVRVDVYPTKDGRIVEGLKASDFEIFEDGVPQKVDTFEHVVATIGPHTARVEPNSQRDMNQALANPRTRVFLIFLDTTAVDFENSRLITEPLIGFLKQYLADDDLVGVMTPGMSATQVVFGRKTAVIESGLRQAWPWGRRNMELDPELDRRQIQYALCYPGAGDVAGKMSARSRERATLEALQDVVRYLASVRDERKAVVAVTQGWTLYREDPDMLRKRPTEAPIGVDKIRVGPTGKLTTEDHRNTVNAMPPSQCDADRVYLAGINDDEYLREIIGDANRGNTSFYMIDPSGLTVRTADKSGAMRTLAENTDGVAVLDTNDLSHGFRRMADDMASYYLLGYYASNSKADGRFRSIAVRVKQPGITVRARKGYRAPTESDVVAARRTADPPKPGGMTPVQAAIDRLARVRPDARFRVSAVAGTGPKPSLWVAGELQSTGARPDEFMQGSTATIEAIAGDRSTRAEVTLKPGELTFLAKLELPAQRTGVLDVRVRLASEDGTSPPLSEGVRVDLDAAEPPTLLYRRGVTTGNRLLPAVEPKFSRTERVRIEIPVGPGARDGKPGIGRVLDRGGLVTQVPVAVTERTDEASGQRWITADVTLGALSPGEYAIEVVIARESGDARVLTPVRIVR
jgi:VWFA-related protein